MPKTKKIEDSSSDSDSSGPKDRNPPKKSKTEGKTESSSKSSGSSGGGSKSKDNSWPLDRNRSVSINEFRGKVLVDIREYYQDSNGDTKPGKKGISLSASQWQKLKDAIPEIDEAIKNT